MSQNSDSSPQDSSKWKRKCSATIHDDAKAKFPRLAEEVIVFSTGRRITSTLKQLILSKQWIVGTSRRSEYICGGCIQYANEYDSESATSAPTPSRSGNDETGNPLPLPSSISDNVLTVIKHIKSNTIPAQLLLELATALGEAERPQFTAMASRKIKEHKKDLLLKSTYFTTWENFECKIFRGFLDGVCDIRSSSNENKTRIRRHFVSAGNSICMAINPRFMHPISVAQNIVLHSYSGSKTACQMFGTLQPSGRFTHLSDFVEELSTDRPTFPVGDIFVAFDNQQIVGKEYRVNPGHSQPTSVVTSMAVYKEDIDLGMQLNTIPTDLTITEANRSKLWDSYVQLDAKCKIVHNNFRQNWLEERLRIVSSEINFDDGSLEDQNLKNSIGSKDYESGLSDSRVSAFPSSCKAFDMENLLLNPNSYASVATVLKTIVEMSDATSPERKWITVVCDGAPYTVAANLLKDFEECDVCQKSGRHLKCGHKTHNPFSKIVLRPGAGHIELNLVRAIFKAFFEVFIEPVAIMLGFTTPRALDYCKKALDHHKSWQILQIVYISLTDELLYQYVRRAKVAKHVVSANDFVNWTNEQRWPNFRMASDFVFNILHPLFLFRAGIRQCNDEVAIAGLNKAAVVFFGFNHPKYRIIMARDMFYLLSLPEIGAGPAKRMGYRLRKSLKGQGLDFLLEERNKAQKQWMFAQGVPSDKQWKKSSSTLTYFEELKENVLIELGIREEEKVPRYVKSGDAYRLARIKFRRVLQEESFEPTTFSDAPTTLPNKFINFAVTCKENMRRYFQAFLNKENCVLNLVDTTELETLSSEELKKKVSSKIRQLSGSVKDELAAKFETCSSNSALIELFGEVEEEISNIDYCSSLF